MNTTTKQFFGESSNSRLSGAKGTARWLLSKQEDESGNKVSYHYLKTNNDIYIDEIRYGYSGSNYKFYVKFNYSSVTPYLVSYRSGLKVVSNKLCSDVFVKHKDGRVIKHYIFNYSTDSLSGIPLLVSIKLKGVDDYDNPSNPTPLTTFSYTDSLKNDLEGLNVHFLNNSGILPRLKDPKTTVVDINGDSLVDIIETSSKGMKVWLNEGQGKFQSPYLIDDFIRTLGSKQTKLLDVDGDRIVDFVTTGLYPKYFKGGFYKSGKPTFSLIESDVTAMPNILYGASGVRSVDLNGDGRLDFLVQLPEKIISILSTGEGRWDRYVTSKLNTSSFHLGSKAIFVQDFNGDGLADIGKLGIKAFVYFENLGDGTFGDAVSYQFSSQSEEILELAKYGKQVFFDDFNGDGISDFLVANDNGFSIAFGKLGNAFSSLLKNYSVFDEQSSKGVISKAFDIDGDGVVDLVWSNDNREFKYFSFVGVKPNLLKKINNGLGKITDILYSSSSRFSDLNQNQIKSSVSFPVVTQVKTSIFSSANVELRNGYDYQLPYYDGKKNEFRGFKTKMVLDYGDESRPASMRKTEYDLGFSNYYLKGKALFDGIFSFDLEAFESKELMSGEAFSFGAHETFTSLDFEKVKNPLIIQKSIIEGDNDPSTGERIHSLGFTYSFEGPFIKSVQMNELDSLGDLYRLSKKTYAFKVDGFGTNRICENWIKNKDNQLVENNRFYFDNQSLCLANSGLLTKEEHFNGSSFQAKKKFTYYSSGNVYEAYDGNNNITTYAYDPYYINLTQVQNPLGHIVSGTYDSELGVLTSFTNENSLTTTVGYDYLLRPLVIVGPLDTSTLPTTKYEYTFGNGTSFSRIMEFKREKSGTVGTLNNVKYFDSDGRSIYEIMEGENTGEYRQRRFDYNGLGKNIKAYNPVFVSDFSYDPLTQHGHKELAYDELGRIRFTYNPQYENNSSSYKETFYKVGLQTDFDELRNTKEKQIDEFGRIKSVKDSKSYVTSYSWSVRDQVSSIIDPQFSSTTFFYDYQGRRICKLDPNIGVTKYTYNANDSVVQKDIYGYQSGASCEAPLGTPRTVLYEYDALKRKTKIDYPTGSSTNDITFNYDESSAVYGVGKLTSADYVQGSKTFEYDAYGLLSKEIQSTTSGTFTTAFQNDVLGRLLKIIYPTVGARSLEVNYSYSSSGRVANIGTNGTSGTIVTNADYNPLEQISRITRSNGIEDHFLYDESEMSYRLVGIEIFNSSKKKPKKKIASSLLSESYFYDEASNLLEKTDLLTSENEEFSYDELNRLIDYSVNSSKVNEFEYDQIGNITKKIDLVTSNYSYDSSRRQILTSVGGIPFTFDIFGNISNDGSRVYTFDWGNRLKSLTRAGMITNYIYDHEGLRVEKQNPTSHIMFLNKYTELKDGVPIYHIFLDNKRVASVDEVGSIHHLHQDHLGSNSLRTNSSGVVTYSQKYYPFGEGRVGSSIAGSLFSLYTDQYRDQESDIYYYKQRYYSQNLGRFIGADPLYAEELDTRGIDSQELNLYAYGKNNPLKYIDNTGLSTSLVSDMGWSREFQEIQTNDIYGIKPPTPDEEKVYAQGVKGLVDIAAGAGAVALIPVAAYVGPSALLFGLLGIPVDEIDMGINILSGNGPLDIDIDFAGEGSDIVPKGPQIEMDLGPTTVTPSTPSFNHPNSRSSF